jgi:hypothetical protein
MPLKTRPIMAEDLYALQSLNGSRCVKISRATIQTFLKTFVHVIACNEVILKCSSWPDKWEIVSPGSSQ